MYKIEHVGIAVKNLADSLPLYEKLLASECYKLERVESEGVITAFFRAGESKIELLESADPDGVIAKYISQRGEGLHHIAFEVADINAEMARLKEAGFRLLRDEPSRGADNKWVCFIHPKSAGGVLVELCQEREME
ncbi:MAG: methylmalonyl-CoA epimerase [Sediminibacterium sp.]|jgi:methylmalonyl-CoA/ethylmalonyl-CoA epimerase|nr:methylmalonyl-CoA epimerase [Sediminibacterium sp.]